MKGSSRLQQKLNEYIASHERFTADDVLGWLSTNTKPRSMPNAHKVKSLLARDPLVSIDDRGLWKRIKVPADIVPVLYEVKEQGIIGMEDLRGEYAGAADGARALGLIQLTEIDGEQDAMLTHRGILYTRGWTNE